MGTLTDFFDNPFGFFSSGSSGAADSSGFDLSAFGGSDPIQGPTGTPDYVNGTPTSLSAIGGSLGVAAGKAMISTAKGGGSAGGFMQPNAPSYHRFQPVLGTSAGKEAASTKPAQVADAVSIHNMWVNRMRAFSGLFDKNINNGE